MPEPQVKIVVPGPIEKSEIVCGVGTKVFISGIEFENLKHIHFKTDIGADEIITSTISLTFYGDVIVERDNA